MLQDHATIRETRTFLLNELSRIYPGSEAEAMARMILEHCGYRIQDIILDPDLHPGTVIIAQIKEIVREMQQGKPIQYVLGYTWFAGLKIGVGPGVLIPRPETEELVHQIKNLQGQDRQHILDLGTGSGCIAFALKNAYPHARVSGLDISEKALRIARRNKEELKLDVDFIEGDLCNLPASLGDSKWDLIVSNPPYVLEKEKKQMQNNVLDHEPGLALFVEDQDPLHFYRPIAELAARSLRPGGEIWLEINEAFGEESAALFNNSAFAMPEILKDIHEKDRFVRAIRQGE